MAVFIIMFLVIGMLALCIWRLSDPERGYDAPDCEE